MKIEKLHRKYWKKVSEVLKNVNVVLEVLDARFPLETRNKFFEKKVKEKGKRLIIVLNKIDLVPKKFLYRELSILKDAVPVSCKLRKGKKKLLDKIRETSGELRVGVIGYPNVGKSSLINYLKGKRAAGVSPIPGYTHGVQWIRVGRILFYDTPGVLPPQTYKRMVILGAVDPSVFEDPVPAAYVLIKKIEEVNPKVLENYSEFKGDVDKFLLKVANKYNFKKKGGEPDVKRAALKILNDWIKGKLKVFWI